MNQGRVITADVAITLYYMYEKRAMCKTNQNLTYDNGRKTREDCRGPLLGVTLIEPVVELVVTTVYLPSS